MSKAKDASAPDLRPQVDIDLQFPVELDGQTTKVLTMRRPKVSDNLWLERQKGGDFAKIVAMAARLCNVTPELLAEMDEIDMKAVDDQYAAFRGDGAS